MRVIVIAEDFRLIQSARALPASRFDVEVIADFREAIVDIESSGCDVAIVDLQVGGFSFGKDLRALDNGAGIALIMTCDRPEDRWLCLQGGADAVLVKPLSDPRVLIEAVDEALLKHPAA